MPLILAILVVTLPHTASGSYEEANVLVTVWTDRNENGLRDAGEEIVRPPQIMVWVPGKGFLPWSLSDPKEKNALRLQTGLRYLLNVTYMPPGTLDYLVGWGHVDLSRAPANSTVEVGIALRPNAWHTDELALTNGYFVTKANGFGGMGTLGFAIVNDGQARFWEQFQRLGGVDALGYPASRRFLWDGFVSQATQKQVLQWRPETGQVAFVNVFDQLTRAGKDDWLLAFRQVPKPFDWSGDAGLPWEAIVARHLALLDRNPALKARYLAQPEAIAHFGLPMAYAEFPTVSVLRAQRAVLQHWKQDVPWARAGEVTIANGGDIAKEAGLIPQAATVPEPPPAS